MDRQKLNQRGAGILGALLLMSATAFAQSGDGPSGPYGKSGREQMEGRFKKMEKELGLTPDQEKKLEEHRKAHREQSRQLFEQMKEKRAALRAELEKPELNMEQVKAIHNELKTIQNKLADQRLDGILEVRKILTLDQFKKFHELMMKKDGKGGHGPDGDGPGDMPPPK